MGIFSNVAAALESKTTSIADYTWSELFPQTNAKSGVAVNIDSSLRVTTVFACARVLAEGIAQLPICVMEEDADGNHTEVKSPLVNILSRRPNDWMTSFEFREQMMFHAVLTGNAYAYLGWGGGQLQEIIPLVPGNVMVQRNNDWTLEYHVSDLAGSVTLVPSENILHLKGPSWNGYLGMEAVQLAREAIGLAITTEETHASLHANGAQPGGVLAVKGKLDAPARERLKAAWQAFQGGVANKFKTAVLDGDSTWTPMPFTGVDSQHLQTREFQIVEICRAFRVFPQMVMQTDKTSTFASAEAFFTSHVYHSLMPWVERWQQALDHALFPDAPQFRTKLNVNEILKGDAAARSDFYMKALGGARGETAYMTRNEVRKREGLNPIEGGDKLLMPPAAPIAAPVVGVKYSPDQARAPNGQFGSGSGGADTNHLLRVGATVAVQSIIGALKGGEGGGKYGAVAGAAIGAAIAAFVEFGGANFVGENIIALVGPHVLPDWAHNMLVDHHENLGKAFHALMFDALSDEDRKRFCLDTLKRMSPEMLKTLGEKIVAHEGNKSYSFKYNPSQPRAASGRWGSSGGTEMPDHEHTGFAANFYYGAGSQRSKEKLGEHFDAVRKAVDSYQNSRGDNDAYTINQELRQGNVSAGTSQAIANLDKAFEVLGKDMPRDVVVHRAIGTTRGAVDFKVGDVVTDQGFTSTTVSKYFVDHWAEEHKDATRVDILVPQGTRVLGIMSPGDSSEGEVLLKHGSKFHVDSITNGTVNLRML